MGRGMLSGEGRRAWWARAARVAAVTAAAAAALYGAATLGTGWALRREAQSLRAARQLVDLEDLVPRPGLPARNAAGVYQQAFSELRISEGDRERLFSPDARWDEALLARAREVVAANQRYYDLLARGSRMPYCAFPVAWFMPRQLELPHLAGLEDAGHMLLVRISVLAAEGRRDEALEDCGTALRIAEHAKADPIVVAQLVAYGIEGEALVGLRRVLAGGSPSAEACRKLSEQLARCDHLVSCLRAMQGERLLQMTVWDRGGSGALRPGFERLFRPVAHLRAYRLAARPLFNLDKRDYLRATQGYLEALSLAWPASERRAEAIRRAGARAPRYRGRLLREVVPDLAELVAIREAKAAAAGAARVALGAAAFRAERGRYPESLRELTASGWQLPADPFSDGPYHSRCRGGGFVVWSVGPDMTDDAGRDAPATGELPAAKHYDIVFRCGC